jgi:hypothetical protein
MSIDSPKKPFSKRYGYRSQPKEITIWEDAPENLHHFVFGDGWHGWSRTSDVRNLN